MSLHDVHTGSEQRIRKQISVLQGLGVEKTSLLAIPRYHGGAALEESAGTAGWLREVQEAGHEMVLHGYYHLRMEQPDPPENFFWTKFYTAGEAEFLDLPPELAAERIADGLRRFAGMGLKPKGFIAPGWLMSAAVEQVIFQAGFLYTNTVGDIRVSGGRRIAARSLCWSVRAAWRRVASLGWNALLWLRLSNAPIVRLSLHPADLEHEPIRRQIVRIVEAALRGGCQPMTYSECVERYGQV